MFNRRSARNVIPTNDQPFTLPDLAVAAPVKMSGPYDRGKLVGGPNNGEVFHTPNVAAGWLPALKAIRVHEGNAHLYVRDRICEDCHKWHYLYQASVLG